jgi:succinoglycan biosynthesis transport protein ExoP
MSFQGINPKPEASAERSEIGFADILAGLRARLGLIVRVTVLVVAAAVVVVSLLPTRYTSASVIMLDQRRNTVADLQNVLSALPTDPASIQNQIQILESRDLAAEVIAKLKLYDDPEFNPSLSHSLGGEIMAMLNPKSWFARGDSAPADPAVQRDAIIDNFLSHTWAESVGLSTTITINATSRDAAKAARIADAVAQTYVDDLVEQKLRASDATSAWLTTRIRELGAQVQAQEAAALTYRAQHNLDSSAGGTQLMEAQLGGINGQIVQARADLSAKMAVYNQVQTLQKQGDSADISQVIASPLMVQLRTQQADLLRQQSALAIPYGPKHPKRIAVENQVKDLDQKIGEEGSRIVGALGNDVAVARAQLGSLEGSLNATQHHVSAQDLTAVRLHALESEADSSRKLYDAFLSRLTGIQDQEGLQYPDAHVISRSAVPSAPSSPQRMLIVMASIPAGLMLGCLAALLSLRFAGARRREPVVVAPVRRPVPQSVPQRQPMPQPQPAYSMPPLIADVPGALSAGAAEHVIDHPAAPFSRAIANLLTRIAPARGTARIVSVTSAETRAAGTTVALALARAAAAGGLRTILIDGDLASTRLAQASGLRPQAGLIEVLGGKTTLNRALMRDSRSAALVLATVQPARDPDAAIASPKVAELFSHLRKIADLIIVASPPVLGSAEAQGLARLSDAVVMVARPEERPQPGLGRALQTLAQGRSAPVGMVLVH